MCNLNRWECGPSKFPWEFTAIETMFLLEGKVKVYVDGRNTNTRNWVILQNPKVNRRKIEINPQIYIAY